MSAPSTTDEPTAPPRTKTPGWPEILTGSAAFLLAFAAIALTLPLIDDPATQGIAGLFASGALGLVAFGAAVLLRIRSIDAFGFRRTTPARILVGAGLGIATYLLGVLVAIAYITVTGDAENVQAGYQAAAAGGWLSLAVTLIAGAVITPLGEEAFFRGVLANALIARHGAWVGVLVSAAVFAVAHGINPVLPIAFVVGVSTALLYRWSGSVWPGVALHATNNATAFLVPLAINLGLA
ncbi:MULTISPECIES: CPBP family intramembrane glutamic endopeptidase [unclassified Microcella]|uniref:CPBP family intramembrane glutamic endopeptidase n=1 Tax=unclassified Microcella TaxID=2630066 RepID=UPI0006F8DC61|nr:MULTISPECIES: type II CAAX endopeptidase family protein [unclassified Microcella]KQV25209.1 hypothetical protein ASC54_12240 [Yonghaparkia sp. Root332]KRF31491.1 hypothetical protein ASG83_12045 [Yonghaparkia sp. Soil809]